MAYTAEQRKVINALRREALKRYTSPRSAGGRRVVRGERKKTKSSFLTGITETRLRNLRYGHGTSVNWRQEIDAYGPVAQRMKLPGSVNRYFNEADAAYTPGQSSSSLSQEVQRSAYPGRYALHRKEASRLTKKTFGKGAVRGSGGASKRESHTKLKKVPGVDRSADRRALLMTYLDERDRPDALMNLARGLPETVSTPSRLKAVKVKGAKLERPSGKTGLSPGGSYHGTENIVKGAVEGLSVSNFKRTPSQNAAVGGSPTSDHLTTNRNAFAADVPFGSGRRLAKRLGIKNWSPGSYTRHIVRIGGKRFSVQILERVEGHYDHTHLGVQAL